MTELVNEHGVVCARIEVFPEDGEAWAIAVFWEDGVGGLPDARTWDQAMASSLAECRRQGAAIFDSRVITASEGVDEALAAARARMHRDSLVSRGFRQGEGRVEYRMNLDAALATLEAGRSPVTLSWDCIDAADAAALAHAAQCLRLASEGDPGSHPEDDALGFLHAFLENEKAAKVPERIQIGMHQGLPAAILLLMVHPGNGWSTIYYLGVLPAFRGRGLGTEAMLHAFRCLKAMGGKIYQDGTASNNQAACTLFARLGQPPFRVMEEWRLEK